MKNLNIYTKFIFILCSASLFSLPPQEDLINCLYSRINCLENLYRAAETVATSEEARGLGYLVGEIKAYEYTIELLKKREIVANDYELPEIFSSISTE